MLFPGISDLNAFQIQYPYGPAGATVHEGFYGDWESLRVEIESVVVALKKSNPSFGITATGHSLGAALAAFCALDLTQRYGYDVLHYTYGEPRIGNEVGSRGCNCLQPFLSTSTPTRPLPASSTRL